MDCGLLVVRLTSSIIKRTISQHTDLDGTEIGCVGAETSEVCASAGANGEGVEEAWLLNYFVNTRISFGLG